MPLSWKKPVEVVRIRWNRWWAPLSDETKIFHQDRYRDFFSRPKFPRPRLFFETKYFRDQYRYSQKIEKSLDTEKSRDKMSHSAIHIIQINQWATVAQEVGLRKDKFDRNGTQDTRLNNNQ